MRYWLIVALATVSACGGDSPSPTAPSPPPIATPLPAPSPAAARISGTWVGSMRFQWDPGDSPSQSPAGMYTVAVRADIQQHDRAIAGTWRITTANNDANGEISGTLEGADATTTFNGTVTWESEPSTMTGRCRGTTTFSGSAWGGINWQSPTGWDFRGTCRNSLSQVSWQLRAE